MNNKYKNNRVQRKLKANKNTNFTRNKTNNSNRYRPIRIEPNVTRSKPELKFIDLQINPTINSTGVVAPFPMPNQGLTSNDRIADRCFLSHLDLRLSVTLTNGSADILRMIVIQSSGLIPVLTPPAVADILQYSNVNSPYTYNIGPLFHILCDRTFTMSDQGDTQIKHIVDTCTNQYKLMRFVPTSVNVYSGQTWYLLIGTNVTGQPSFLSSRQWFTDSE